MKAAVRMARNPETENSAVDSVPPSSSMTSATPSPAPALMPNTSGPASGLRNAVCSSRPQVASELPHSMAVSACGSRLSQMIYRQLSFPVYCPDSISSTSGNGIRTDPTVRFSPNSRTVPAVRMIKMQMLRLIV